MDQLELMEGPSREAEEERATVINMGGNQGVNRDGGSMVVGVVGGSVDWVMGINNITLHVNIIL